MPVYYKKMFCERTDRLLSFDRHGPHRKEKIREGDTQDRQQSDLISYEGEYTVRLAGSKVIS
jgi:hypothetical protein